jgi:murein DD-endopeptidase MepM/ murein hydrolase activator NlpD
MKFSKTLFVFILVYFLSNFLTALEYKVQKGDNLSGIAKKYHITVKAIQEANHITGVNINAGQKLEIPIPGDIATRPNTAKTTPTPPTLPTKTEPAKAEVAKKQLIKETTVNAPRPKLSEVVSESQKKTIEKKTETIDTTYQLSTPKNPGIYVPLGADSTTHAKVKDTRPGTLNNTGIIIAIALMVFFSLLVIYLAIIKWVTPILEDMKTDILRRIPVNLGDIANKPRNFSSFEFERRFEKIEKLIMSHERNLYSLISSLIQKTENGHGESVELKNELPIEGIPVRITQEGKVERHTAFHCYLELIQKEDYYECYLCSYVKSPLPLLNQNLSTVFDLEDQELNTYKVVLPAIFEKDETTENQVETWSLLRRGIIVY